jgi:hypothetical protein
MMATVDEIAESALLKLTARVAWPIVAVAVSAIGTLAWWQWEKVNDLAERVPVVEQSIALMARSTLEKSQALDGEIAEVHAKLDGIQNDVSDIHSGLAVRTTQIESILSHIDSIDAKLDRLFVPRHAEIGVPGSRTTALERLHSPPVLALQK